MLILIALSFLTIIPFTKGKEVEPPQMAASMSFFPLVGLWLGALLWGADYYLGRVLNPVLTSAILVALLALITGGLHLDGFADTLDGIFGGRGDKARILDIMKDSRVGAMGVIGIVLLLIMKTAALSSLPAATRGQALILMPTLARWSQVQMAMGAQYARKENSLARPFVEFLEFKHFAVATIFAAGSVFLFSAVPGYAAFFFVALVTLAGRLYFTRAIGGVTGDTIGAISELNELVVILAFCAVSGLKV